jgi:uncharacterized protein YwqG
MPGPKQIPPFRLVPQPVTEAAAILPGFKWAAKAVGTRHQLGGEPSFIQAPDYPDCDSCRQRMTFYGQLDSINDDFVIGDVGMVYVFICFDCLTTKSILQSS